MKKIEASQQENIKVYSAIILAMFFWGLTFVWTDICLKYLEPVSILLFRLLLSSILLFSFMKILKIRMLPDRKDVGLILLTAFLNPFLYFLGESYGVKFSSPTVSAVFIAIIPAITPIAAYFVYAEKLSWMNVLGLSVSVFGVLLMIIKPDYSAEATNFGLLSLGFAVIVAIAYSILLKPLAIKYNPFAVIAWQNFIGVFLFLPLFFLFEWQKVIHLHFTFELVSSLVWLAIFGSSLAFVFYTYCTKKIGVSRTAIFTNFIPAFTAVFAWWMVDEVFDTRKILGILLAIAGISLAQIKKGRKKVVHG